MLPLMRSKKLKKNFFRKPYSIIVKKKKKSKRNKKDFIKRHNNSYFQDMFSYLYWNRANFYCKLTQLKPNNHYYP